MAGKQQKMMMLTVEELEAMRDEAVENARKQARAEHSKSAKAAPAEGISVEEMLAMREQYEQRIAEESQRREDLEWRLRLAIARLRDVESATDKLRAIQDSLKGVLGEVASSNSDDEEKTQPRGVEVRRVQPPAVPARALRTVKRALA
jgi:chromosome segregation ATPase